MATAKETIVAEDKQPALFSVEQLPAMPQLLAAAETYTHTGKTTCKDEELCQLMISFYLATGSLRATARRFSMSAHTVSAVVGVYETSGKMAALKQRLSNKLGVSIELATDLLNEKLLEGCVPANVLPIVIGVGVEKKALLDGEATSRSEAIPAKPVALGDLAAYLRSQGVPAPAIDVASTVLPEKPQ